MKKKTEAFKQAEELVKTVLEKYFNQKVDKETLHQAAEKLAKSVSSSSKSKKAA